MKCQKCNSRDELKSVPTYIHRDFLRYRCMKCGTHYKLNAWNNSLTELTGSEKYEVR